MVACYLKVKSDYRNTLGRTGGSLVFTRKVEYIAAASLGELERDGAKAVISAIVLMEVWDAMMATRDAVNDWLDKRREKARAEGGAIERALWRE